MSEVSHGIAFPHSSTLHGWFERIVERRSDLVALRWKGQSLSFGELKRRADCLARFLIAQGIQTEDLVAFHLERSFDMIAAIFGILEAGGAYVPIDVGYPPERVRFMLEDSGAKVVFTQRSLQENLKGTEARIVCLDEVWPEIEATHGGAPAPEVEVHPQNLAYCIYTSGSTGKPKGCLLTHENVMAQLEGQQAIAPEPIGRMVLTVSISFDVSVLSIFWSLLQGAPLVLPEQGEERDMPRLAALIEREQVTHMLTLPSPYTLLLDQAQPEQLRSLRLVNVSGEVCPTSLAQKHERLVPGAQLYNLYG
ncbi:MAG: non-ribosomal peptide synthetase, partial [Bacteroidetes bacterium]